MNSICTLLALIKDTKVVMGVCIPRNLKGKIDDARGDVPRSKYISKILERVHNKEKKVDNNLENQGGETRHQPISPTTDFDSVMTH